MDIMSTREVFDLTNTIKREIVGDQQSKARIAQRPPAAATPAG